ncbi:DUF1289 domain-containing protein [Rhodoferax saidenbachensis]|uniref:Fe-S protein YdhL (DUF1289 family) n=1 Tax=Rhodoferax saidenbachensis TaxID=1484693 RepID=A0ABU1ZRS5_9BURK|nr:DUF1289 domain-containing protein [Rhodoferax saidenbachensis]MDR7308088.1 putative Fe-S protein YdhL (DUF1289 family) [Rhodoferax saidenbachensis]
MSAIKRLAARAVSMRAVADNVPSPCSSVCRMGPSTGLCEGCFRSLDEIRDWSTSTDATKQQVWAAIARRIATAYPQEFPA